MASLLAFEHTQPHVVRALTNALGRDALHHAVALVGRGAADLGRALFERRACNQAQAGACDPCAICTDCKMMAKDGHPDAFVFEKPLSLDEARGLTQRLALRPRHAARHLVWFTSPELLSVGVQNALLKAIEEPPTQTFFLFTLGESDVLLSTLRSRLLTLRLRPNVTTLASSQDRTVEASKDPFWLRAALDLAARGDKLQQTQLIERGAASFLHALKDSSSRAMPRDAQILMSQKFSKESLELHEILLLTEAYLRITWTPGSDKAFLAGDARYGPSSREAALRFVWSARQELILHPNRTFFIERLLHAISPERKT